MFNKEKKAKEGLKKMHDEIVSKMDARDKGMYELLKMQGDLENIMHFGYHIGKKQAMEDIQNMMLETLKKVTK